MEHLKSTIEAAFTEKDNVPAKNWAPETKEAILETLSQLDCGALRIAEKNERGWQVNEWAKKAVLLSFRLYENKKIDAGFTQFFDKIPMKFEGKPIEELEKNAVRIVPPACARRGAYIAPNTVLMPSYVNIGAYIDSGTLIDTWATVGSCAQIGKNVHISGGVGIGGVLEPLQAAPTIIEDNCFIGARSEIVEGVIVEKGAVISMGVFIGQSTPIYNRETDEVTYGKVPAGSVVVSGNLPAKNGKYSRYCALIVKQVDEKTRAKTALNDLLRSE